MQRKNRIVYERPDDSGRSGADSRPGSLVSSNVHQPDADLAWRLQVAFYNSVYVGDNIEPGHVPKVRLLATENPEVRLEGLFVDDTMKAMFAGWMLGAAKAGGAGGSPQVKMDNYGARVIFNDLRAVEKVADLLEGKARLQSQPVRR